MVVFFADFGLIAYDHDGNEKWRAPLGPFDNVYGMGASPILAGGNVVLVCDQSRGSFASPSTPRPGGKRWRAPRPEALSGHSTPALFEPPGGPLQVLAPGSFRLDAYDAGTGRVVLVGERPALGDEVGAGPGRGRGLRRRATAAP